MIRTSGQDNGRGNKSSGQTALVLILLTAAALIFYAISLNWGRIAQEKALLTTAADQAAAVLASDAASYGESLKVQWLGDQNSLTESTGAFINIIMIVIAVVLTVLTAGAGAILSGIFLATAVMAAANLTLQLTVIQPGITSMWNSQMLKDQPNYEQFYEQGIQAALAGSITDQVNIADYFDSNANGIFGLDPATGWTTTRDSLGRFAFFYSERLKMLNAKARIPQIQFFYDQLGQFMNGQTCADNLNNHAYDPLYLINPVCKGLDCSSNSLSTAGCQTKIAGTFQLNDPCPVDMSPGDATYNPYCDPCCQPYFGAPDPLYNPSAPTPNNHPYPLKVIRPTSCTALLTDSATCLNVVPANYTACASSCARTDNSCLASCVSNADNDPSCFPTAPECVTNNPYNTAQTFGVYPYIYDPAFQNYPDTVSFLAQFGRDQQITAPPPPSPPPPPFTLIPDVMTCPNGDNPILEFPTDVMACPGGHDPILEFPNGVYPFFWLMKDYSPQVDNIVSTSLTPLSPQLYWCAAGGGIPIAPPAPTGFPDLAQLTLPAVTGWAGCSGQNCCVNRLGNSVTAPASYDLTKVIDTVGDPPTPTSNPALNPTFGEPSPPAAAPGPWTEGDNQFCSPTWPYNGSSGAIPGGTCELGYTPASAPTKGSLSSLGTNPSPTVDQLDNVMHTLSDFVNFANTFLNKDIGQLNSTFHSWYPSVAKWIAPKCDNSDWQHSPPVCNPGSDGRLLSIYNSSFDLLGGWDDKITKWLKTDYTNVNAWCVPPQTDPSMNVAGVGPTAENTYIAAANSGKGKWGDLPHVIACLNYNGNQDTNDEPATFGSVYNFQQCSNDFKASPCSVTTDMLNDCSAVTLGRSLAGPYTGAGPGGWWNGTCTDPAFTKWVNDSLILATSQAPKFAMRSAFLTDIFRGAQNMENIFNQGSNALAAFLKPCTSVIAAPPPCPDGSMCGINKNGQCADGTACGCQGGGPAAQLMWARGQPDPAAKLPNFVIYGWQDRQPIGGGGCTDSSGNKIGCAHIVKVTAYSAGRCGGICNSNNGGQPGGTNELDSLLPWIQTSSDFWSRTYALTDRDEFVHVTIQRWDQDHANVLSFPNGLPLWTFSFHKPGLVPPSVLLQSDCFDPSQSLGGIATGTGIGLTSPTYTALQNYSTLESGEKVLPQDAEALSQAFMLNGGSVDLNHSTQGACKTDAEILLGFGMKSEACAQYIATDNATASSSGDNDANYKIIFENCPY